MIVLTIGLKLVDFLSTIIAVQSPNVSEFNPLWDYPIVGALILFLSVIGFVIAVLLIKKYKIKSMYYLFLVLLILVNIYQIFIIYNNIGHILFFL
jgi:hypothetical protein